jgi:hypothetical protein
MRPAGRHKTRPHSEARETMCGPLVDLGLWSLEQYRPIFFRMKPPTGYWTFFFKPSDAYVHKALATDPNETRHTIRQRRPEEFANGQLGIIRACSDTRNKGQLNGDKRLQPGVYAIVEVVGRARPMPSDDPQFYPQNSTFLKVEPRVPLRIIRNLVHSPITVEELR